MDSLVESTLAEQTYRLRRGVLWGTLLLCVLFASIDFLAIRVVNLFIAATMQRSSYSVFFEFCVWLFCGLIFAQWSSLWLWLRRNVRRRIVRLLAGVIGSHLIVGAVVAGNLLTTYSDGKLINPYATCATFYFYFIILSVLAEGWLWLFRIEDVASHPQRTRSWSLMDLFVASGVAALIALELVISSRAQEELDLSNGWIEWVLLVVLALATSLMVTLSLGACGSENKKRFVFAFFLVSLVAPIIISIGVTLTGGSFAGAATMAYVFWAAMVLGILLVFPLLRPFESCMKN